MAKPSEMPPAYDALIFQGLKYDFFDHYFEQDDDDEDADTASEAEQSEREQHFKEKLREQEKQEVTVIMYGSEMVNGTSVCLGVRGYRPSLYLALDNEPNFDMVQQLKKAKERMHAIVEDIYNGNIWKKALQAHVLLDAMVIEWKKSVYFYQHKPSPFLKVSFRSLAAYNHFTRTLNSVKLLQQHPDQTETVTMQAIREVEHRIAESQKMKNLKKAATKEQKTRILSTAQEQNLNKKLEALKRIRIAQQKTQALSAATRSLSWSLYNSSIDTTVQFLQALGSTSQWFAIEHGILKQSRLHCDRPTVGRLAMKGKHRGVIAVEHITVQNDIRTVAPFMQCGFDLETYAGYFMFKKDGKPELDEKGRHKRVFPDPTKPLNDCFQIGMTFHRFGRPLETMERHLLTLGNPQALAAESPEHSEHVVVHRLKTEKELICEYFKLVDAYDVDVFYSFNGHDFDDPYLYHRGVFLGLIREQPLRYVKEEEMNTEKCYGQEVVSGMASELGTRLPGRHIKLEHSVFQSGAAGTNHLRRLVMPGRLHIDLHPYMKNNAKLPR